MKNVSGLTVALQKILGISFVLMGRGGRVTTQEYLKAKLCSKSDNWGWGGGLGKGWGRVLFPVVHTNPQRAWQLQSWGTWWGPQRAAVASPLLMRPQHQPWGQGRTATRALLPHGWRAGMGRVQHSPGRMGPQNCWQCPTLRGSTESLHMQCPLL